MKNIFKYISLLTMSLVLFQSCEEGDKTVDFVLEEVTRGATLRTMNLINGSVNIFDLENSVFEVELEYRDNEGGVLFESYDVYASFIDNTDDGVDNSKPEVFLKNVPSSELPINNEFGFPRGVLQLPATQTFAALGLDQDQLNGGDVVAYRLVLKLTDGREFSTNASGRVTGGSFFSSPFLYNASLVCLFDEPDFFSGTYLLEQVEGATGFGALFGTQTVEVAADGINRTCQIAYFPGFDIAMAFEMELICGKITVKPNENTLSCDGATGFGWVSGTPSADFDVNFVDDDVIEVNVEDANPDGGCGIGSAQIVLRFTKQ